METILFLAHPQDDGRLSVAALETLTAARELAAKCGGAPIVAALVGAEVQPAANQLAAAGCAKILGVSGAEFAAGRYASDAAAVAALVSAAGATLVLAPACPRFSRALPGVAQRLGGRCDTQVCALSVDNGAVQAQRWYYRQRMLATLTRPARPWLLTVASGNFPAAVLTAGQAAVTPVAVTLPALRTKVLGVQTPPSDAQTIRPDARLLFVAGAGWTKKQADGRPHVADGAALILGFLGATQASLGSSKSLVDQRSEGQEALPFLSHLNQVGQTGSTPRHLKGLATCCHGEEPHVVGWRFISERRAVNLDPNCGWAQGKADVLYVADAFALMAKVNALLTTGK